MLSIITEEENAEKLKQLELDLKELLQKIEDSVQKR